jgi:hypothetical protein
VSAQIKFERAWGGSAFAAHREQLFVYGIRRAAWLITSTSRHARMMKRLSYSLASDTTSKNSAISQLAKFALGCVVFVGE